MKYKVTIVTYANDLLGLLTTNNIASYQMFDLYFNAVVIEVQIADDNELQTFYTVCATSASYPSYYFSPVKVG